MNLWKRLYRIFSDTAFSCLGIDLCMDKSKWKFFWKYAIFSDDVCIFDVVGCTFSIVGSLSGVVGDRI